MTKNEDLLLQHLKKQRRNRADPTPTHSERSRQKRIQFWQGNKRFCEKSSKRGFKCLLLVGAMFASWATLTLISGTRRGIQYPFQTDFWKSKPTQNGYCLHVTSTEKISREILV